MIYTMKKFMLLAAMLLVFPSLGLAQDGVPSIKDSVNYYTNFFNESVVQAIELQQHLQKEKPGRDESYFCLELIANLEKSIDLAFNVRDLYFIYGRTMYCYAKDERKFVMDRVGNILVSLNAILQYRYFGLDAAELDPSGFAGQNAVKFQERLKNLIAYTEKSSAIFK